MKSIVTIGTFDGVHIGHQELLRTVLQEAKTKKLSPVAVVFPKPPRAVFQPQLGIKLITLPKEKAALLRAMGFKRVLTLPFTRKFARTGPEQFFDSILVKKLGAKAVRVGQDFAMGKDRRGDVHWMKAYGAERGVEVRAFKLIEADGLKISSTHIRRLLEMGEVALAGELLGRPYAVSGPVFPEQGLGRRIGFPTANLDVDEEKFLPPGVFRCDVLIGTSKKAHLGVLNIGTRPTVSTRGKKMHVEVHLPDWSGSLYGKTLTLRLRMKLRDEKKFPSLDALKAQIAKDVLRARA